MSKYVEIRADQNDADYITERSSIEEDDIPLLQKICDILKNNGYEWCKSDFTSETPRDPYVQYKDLLTEDEITFFDELCPYNIHSIDSVTILNITYKESLLGYSW